MRIPAAAFIVALAASPLALADCGSTRDTPESRFRQLLVQGKYDELERAAHKAENLAERTPDGLSLHAAFIAAMWLPGSCNSPAEGLDANRVMAAEGYGMHLAEWLKRYPGSRMAILANARQSLNLAWAARGGGYASEVGAQAWEVFHENVAKARSALAALPAPIRDDPAWYEVMLQILKAQSAPDAEYDALFNEAVARYPEYDTLWFEAATRSAPKWGGSVAKVRAIAERAADATRAKRGETLYARVQWANEDSAMFRSGQADWPRMKAGFERIMQDYPDNWNANNFGNFACRAHDPDGLRKAFAHIEKPIPAVWDVVPFETCKQHVNDPAPGPQVSR